MMVKRKCYFRQSAVDRPFDKGTFEQKPEDVGKGGHSIAGKVSSRQKSKDEGPRHKDTP